MRLLDLFCGAGGAAVGYHRAGFTEIVGVDIKPQPRYPFTFVLGDALAALDDLVHARAAGLTRFDVIHASPPCQAYSQATAWRGDRASHPALIEEVREALAATGLPFVIENVAGARHVLRPTVMLCGTMLGLPAQSHRWFEIRPADLYGLLSPCHHGPDDASRDHGAKQPESAFRSAIGCDWMTVREAREAIPPAYTEWIGRQLLQAVAA